VHGLTAADLKARVDTRNLAPGRHRLTVSVQVPGGVSLVRCSPAIVTVTKSH
jgi:YbbR domain-containing protein